MSLRGRWSWALVCGLACSSPPPKGRAAVLERVELELPPHFPDFPRPLPSRAEADLGRLLFHDFRLSVDDARSCGICHEGKKGYTDGFVKAVGALGDVHTRNTLSLLNLAWRGIHWSGEHIWFFALKFNEDLVEQLSKDHRLKRHKAGPEAMREAEMDMLAAPPAWFAPKGPDYEVWRSDTTFMFVEPTTVYLHRAML